MADSHDALPGLTGRFRMLADEVRSNRKLQYGLLVIVAILVVEFGLSWSDSLSTRERRLQELRTELRQLRGQSRDEVALKAALAKLEDERAKVEKRLWVVSSDPVGQARLKDWLTTLAKEAGAKNFKLVLAAPKAVAERSVAGASGAARVKNAFGLREFRADIGFAFTPEALERVLYAIESGETLASVESLSVALRSRKAELGVRVVMRLGHLADAVDAASALARPGADAGQAQTSAEKATVTDMPAATRPDASAPPAGQTPPASVGAPPVLTETPSVPANTPALPSAAGIPLGESPVPVPPMPADAPAALSQDGQTEGATQ